MPSLIRPETMERFACAAFSKDRRFPSGPATQTETDSMMKLTIAAIAALSIFAFAPAQGGTMMAKGKMQGKAHQQHGNMMHGMKKGQMSTHECCMQGLSGAEKKGAMMMMMGWGKTEQAAWDARCNLCMKDPHTGLMAMQKSGKKPTDAMIHEHMMAGLSKGQQASMGKIMRDKMHKPILMKMITNCCMYGVAHAKGK
jgi:hypothetical protein